MTAPARRQKPTSADETARVLRILDMLGDELHRRFELTPAVRREVLPLADLLAVADRIASRTED
jgi:hypothetical protein